MTTSTFTVVGMTCGHCVSSVRAELGELEGVSSVEVDLDSGRVTVESTQPLSDEAIDAAVEEAGYEVYR
ncbi:MAG: heavy-metal-associated domain-containing protein [Acidimicrobiales bacterium]